MNQPESNGNATGAQEQKSELSLEERLRLHAREMTEGGANASQLIRDLITAAGIVETIRERDSKQTLLVGRGNDAGAAQVSEDWQIRQSAIWRGKHFIGSVTMAADLICQERNAEMRALRLELEQAREALRQTEQAAYDVPLCADHAQAWFTDRHFKEGDCWFCQYSKELSSLREVIEQLRKALEEKDAVLKLLADGTPGHDVQAYVWKVRDLSSKALAAAASPRPEQAKT